MTIITQGVASYTASELAEFAQLYKDGGATDAWKVLSSIVSAADKALKATPHAYTTIVTSGASVQSGSTANTGTVSTQASQVYALAQAYELTGSSKYLTQAKAFLLDWARTNLPTGDSIAGAPFLDMVKAYDLLHGKFSSSEQSTMAHWLGGMADAIMQDQAAALARGSTTATNNHHSWALLEVGTIGAVLGNDTYIHYLTGSSGFLSQVGSNLASIPGQPPYLGVDYQERDAYHYVAYNLQALGGAAVLVDRLAHLPGNPYGIDYNPFTVEVNGASIAHTLDALLPYASGEQQSTHEFQHSTNSNDLTRLANGSLSSVFDPADAIPALEAADYFGHQVNDPLTGHSYSLPQLVADILAGEGKAALSATLPDVSFLQNSIESPYDAAPVTDQMQAVKIATDGGTHTLTAGAGGEDFLFYKHTGHTTIAGFGSGDVIDVENKIYGTVAQALGHVTYSHGNAVLALDGGSTLTLTGIADHGLTQADFHIFTSSSDIAAAAPPPPPVETNSVKIATDSGTHTLTATPAADDFIFYKHTGQTSIAGFRSGDVIDIEHKIYSSADQALSHVAYDHGNAVLALDGGSQLTLLGVADHSLTVADFHAF